MRENGGSFFILPLERHAAEVRGYLGASCDTPGPGHNSLLRWWNRSVLFGDNMYPEMHLLEPSSHGHKDGKTFLY